MYSLIILGTLLLGATPEENYLEQSLEVANLISEERKKSDALSRIATHLAKHTNEIAKATDIAQKVTDRPYIFSNIGFELAQKGLIEQAIEITLKGTNPTEKFYGLWDIGTFFEDEKKQSEYETIVIEHIKKELADYKDLKGRDNCLQDIATELLRKGKWAEALTLSDALYDGYGRERILHAVAVCRAENGQYKPALDMAATITDKPLREDCYDIISELLILKIGQEESPTKEEKFDVDLPKISKMLIQP